MFGVRIGDTREIGSITRCMGWAKLNGLTAASTKESTKMTKSTGRAHSIGRTGENTSGDG